MCSWSWCNARSGGDSLVDPGNNNYILSLARANFPPNVVDDPSGPTGKFCNNRTASDFLGAFNEQI